MFKKISVVLAMICSSYAQADIALNKLTTVHTNLGAGSGEISSYDKVSQRLFMINSDFGSFSIVDISNLEQPVKVSTIDVSAIGNSITSISVFNGLVAVSIAAPIVTDNGTVAFYDVNGKLMNQLTVGALPDMLTFTHQGNKILVANEGEPDKGVDPEGSISIIDLTNGVNQASVTSLGFVDFNNGQPRAGELPTNTIIFPNNEVSQDLEPEYISVLPDDSKAFVTLQENNAVAVIDLNAESIQSIYALGFKDHSLLGNEIDPSNEDGPGETGSIAITNWPVFGMYQPDAIASYQINGVPYFLTANEGDARDEDERIKNLSLDPQLFPNAASLQNDAQLGRLKVSTILGDDDKDGEFEKLYSYGARSFSIWNANTGNQVYDSGSQMAQQIASQTPDVFNADEGLSSNFDDRSDDKGAEPEGIVVANLGDRYYAFVGLERVGGVMVYDITNPQSAQFEVYQPSTDGDRAPEGIVFIPAQDHSSQKNLLLVSHEESGTIAIYEVIDRVFINGFE